MGKNTKIICTVVPNGMTENRLKLSVFLSPRLPDSGQLKDYYEIYHWYKFLGFFWDNTNLEVELANLDPTGDNNYTFKAKCGKASINFEKDKLDDLISESEQKKNYPGIGFPQFVWQCLFKGNTPVKGWILDEGEYTIKTVFLHNATPQDEEGDRGTSAIRHGNMTRTASSDISSNIMSEDEIGQRNKENQEFHRKISILADYPHLLRSTGWILDFFIDG